MKCKKQQTLKFATCSLICCFIPTCLTSLETKPWLHSPWEFNGIATYTYIHFRAVANATTPLAHPSNDQLLFFDLGFTPSQVWDIEAEIELVDTPHQSFGYRSSALQARIQWLDDIAGDCVSWVSGLSIRQVNGFSLKDVSCPYHSNVNIELNTSIGKEWSKGPFWSMRSWGCLGIGMANRGSPWLYLLGAFEKNWNNHHRAQVFFESYLGFGKENHVNIERFNGWGKMDHQSIDIGVMYQYHFDLWGDLSVAYASRLYAHVFPEYVQFVTFSYHLPFSVL